MKTPLRLELRIDGKPVPIEYFSGPRSRGERAPAATGLAPREMAFENRTKHQLAKQLNDPKQAHMTVEELIAHVRDDALVGWGWNPGPGRAPVPMPRDEFIAAFQTWVAGGAPIPEETSK